MESELWFSFDGHGSTRVLLDVAGAIAQVFAYDAYGQAIGFDPAAALTEFLYSGEQFDAKIGQQYLRARYYDPSTGTFNRLDPFFGNLTDPQSLHNYLYCHADPVSYTDPSGEVAIFFLLGMMLGGGIIGAVGAWTAGYDGWGIAAGFGIGAAIPAVAILGAPYYMPLLSLVATKMGYTGIGKIGFSTILKAIAGYGAVATGVYVYENVSGNSPTPAQEKVLEEAKDLIRRTAGFTHYADWLDDIEIRVSPHGGWWGLAPHLTNSKLYVSDMLLANVPPVYIASTLVHEMHHTMVEWPIFQATGRGEKWAYQAQSTFLHYRAAAGSMQKIKSDNNTYTSAHFDNYLRDQKDAFVRYNTNYPAVW